MKGDHNKLPAIIADYRESPSGIPALLTQYGAEVTVAQLKTGDYTINNEIAVERKSAEDFIHSLVSGRLFTQCARLRKTTLRPLLLLEGNPYQTRHQIDHRAVRGALLSISVSWYIPVIYSKNQKDSAGLLLMLANQAQTKNHVLLYTAYKPKRLKNHHLRFLQGLPNTGAVMANRLYEYFGSIEAIVNADVKTLQEVEGVGKKTAEKIRAFVSGAS